MYVCLFLCFKQKTAYDMRISDWSSDVCSSDLPRLLPDNLKATPRSLMDGSTIASWKAQSIFRLATSARCALPVRSAGRIRARRIWNRASPASTMSMRIVFAPLYCRSEEHTSELQSLMRISYAVFCLKKKKKHNKK